MTTTKIGEAREIAAKWYYKELWGWDLEKICTGEERPAFLKSLLVAANGDGILAPEEKKWVIGRAAVSGAPDELLGELEAYKADEDIVDVVSKTLATNKSRRAVIYFAIKASAADGVYNDEEKTQIRRAATAMGISEEEVEEIEKLYAEEERLKEKRIQLCFPDGDPFAK
jgi:uncharacterized membrane protein YebE (DUF533 family)